ncbi:hypothetical protein COW83_03450, partial [Candidatus Collierbacteria bacterium CG22_combo_CG10-13_8_21_14_all_43_12]
MIDTQLKDKVVLVTGANHGIGAATARAMAKQGAKVFIAYFRLGENYTSDRTNLYKQRQNLSADNILTEIKKKEGVVKALELDLSDVKSIKKLFDEVENAFGTVNILVNNAAYCDPDTFEPETSVKEVKTGLTSKTITLEVFEKH